jgi:hypothetical protein
MAPEESGAIFCHSSSTYFFTNGTSKQQTIAHSINKQKERAMAKLNRTPRL